MRSPPPDGEIPLYLVRIGDDHPKACTGRRLLDRGLARPPPTGRPRPPPPLLLDPYAPRPVAPEDRAIAISGGILVVDCSWNILGMEGAFRAGSVPGSARAAHRRLPWLVAGNPQHFGRLAELNSVEALVAALYILGEPERARSILSGFPGGEGLFEVNAAAFRAYVEGRSADGVRAAERTLFGGPRADRTPAPRS